MSSEAMQIELMIGWLSGLKDDHTPDGYPAVRMSTLTECEDMLRTQAASIAELERCRDAALAAHAEAMQHWRTSVMERDQLRAELERTTNNRDMWKGQCERQADALSSLRAEVERLRPNAMRYEFLRDVGWNNGTLFILDQRYDPIHWDRYIDRAIEAAKEA